MRKLGTTLLLAISLLSFTACGKKNNNAGVNNYCGPQYGYAQGQCGAYNYMGGQPGMPGYPGQPYGGQMCQAGAVMVNLYGQQQCLQQGPCQPGFGYHPTILNGGPGCVQGSMGTYGQPYGGGYYGGGYGGGYYGGGYMGGGF